jgi:hypothetical protein
VRPAGAARNHPTTMATSPDAMHPRNQPQRMRTPGGRVSEAVTSAGSVVTIPASVRDSRASNAGIHHFVDPRIQVSGLRKTYRGRRRGQEHDHRNPRGISRPVRWRGSSTGTHETGCATTIRLRLYPPRSGRNSPAQVINTSRGGPAMSKTSASSTRSVRGTCRTVVILYA